jgi:hypothetical protein
MAFREMFQKWCDEEGVKHAISDRRISAALKAQGVIEKNSGDDRFWSGILWRTEAEREVTANRGGIEDLLLGIPGTS